MSTYPTFATIAEAVAAYLAGTTRRHARIDGQVIDLHQAAHPVEVSRGEWVDPDRPCERLFERLAVEDHDRLVGYLAPDLLPPHLLTFAAEHAGSMPASVAVRPLLALLDHESAVVREGAAMGLSCHAGDSSVRRALIIVSESDPSPGVRERAQEAIEDPPDLPELAPPSVECCRACGRPLIGRVP